jgi:hypothetical protein
MDIILTTTTRTHRQYNLNSSQEQEFNANFLLGHSNKQIWGDLQRVLKLISIHDDQDTE